MATQRLPIPGQDNGTWGDILNGFLEVEHNADGTLKIRTDGSVAPLASGKVPTTNLGSGTASSSNFLRGDGSWAVPAGGGTVTSVTATDATVTVGGSATAPTIGVNAIPESKVTNLTTDLAAKANTSSLATVATSGAYTDLTGKPTLATVATSGSYTDLSNKPTIPSAQVNSDWSAGSGVAQILNKPTLATVATSGSYTDLSNKPTIPAAGAQALAATSVKTSAYTAAAGDLIPADASSAGFTVTLPTAPADKTKVLIKKIDSTANVVTIATGGSDVFNKTGGATTGTLSLQYQAMSLQYAASTSIWYVVGEDLPLSQLNATYVAPVIASGDTTGATDTAAINAMLTATGTALLFPGKVYYINAQIVVPDIGGITTIGDGAPAIIRQAAGTNLHVPMVASNNFVNGGASPSAGPLPLSIRNVVIDVNCQNQGYGGQDWLTAGPNFLNGPDGLTVCNTDAQIIDVEVRNPARHGIVTCDMSAGTNTIGIYTGAGAVTSSNVYGIKMRYTVTGWGLITLIYQNACSGTMTAGSTSITGASGTYQPGMVVIGPGVLPGTVVVSVSGSTVTLSQKVGYGSTGTFYTTWGQRGRWNTAGGSGCTDGWEMAGCQVRQMNGDFLSKYDVTGGWRLEKAQHWGGAYSGAQHLFTQNAVIEGNTWSDLGASPVGVATVNGAITQGTFVAPLTVNAIPVALPQYTPLILRTGSGPMFLMTNAAAAAGATSLTVYGSTAPAAISNGATVYLPVVGGLRTAALGGPAADEGNVVYTKENANTDYLYQCWVAADTTNRNRLAAIPNQQAQNYGGVTGASSVAFGYVGPGTNTAYFYGTQTHISEGSTPITNLYRQCGGATIVLDGGPASGVPPVGTTVESFIGSNVTLTSATIINVTSVSLTPGTWLVTGRSTLENQSPTPVDLWLGPTSASVTNAYAGATAGDSGALSNNELEVIVTKSITVTSTTTVYLTAYSSLSNTSALAKCFSQSSVPNASGITAVRIA